MHDRKKRALACGEGLKSFNKTWQAVAGYLWVENIDFEVDKWPVLSSYVFLALSYNFLEAIIASFYLIKG